VKKAKSSDDALLAEMELRGIVRRGKGGVPPELLRRGRRVKGKPLSQILLEERRTGR
jgi:hypothetical protein